MRRSRLDPITGVCFLLKVDGTHQLSGEEIHTRNSVYFSVDEIEKKKNFEKLH